MSQFDRISAKLIVANAVAGVALGGLFAAIAFQQLSALGAEDVASLDRQIRARYQDETRSLTETVVSDLVAYQGQVEAGALSLEDAQAQAKLHIAKMAYSNGGYFWVHTFDPKEPSKAVMVAHPIAALVGKDIADYRYANGEHEGDVAPGFRVDEAGRRRAGAKTLPLFQQMNAVVAESGGGHVAYDWPRKGEATYREKVSYVKLVPGWNWVVGTGIYVDDVDTAVAAMRANTDARIEAALLRLVGTVALVTLCAVLVAIVMGRWLRRRVGLVVERLRDIAEGDGDLTQRIEVTSQDSLGELAEWFNTFVSRIQTMLRSVADSSTPLRASVQSLNSISDALSGTTEQIRGESGGVVSAMQGMRDRLRSVASAAEGAARGVSGVAAANEEMSSNAQTLTGSVDALSANLNSIVSATEEMNLSLSEVSQRCAESASASQQSSEIAQEANSRMATLFEAAKRIGKVVQLIEDIADQTSLLALNATIEAASAGDAGKGFAVVANEVKALAKQTAGATEEIAQQMSSMLQDTDAAMIKIREVSERSKEVNNLASMIAAAVEEQSATTRGIADHVQQSADRAHEMSVAVAELSSGVGELTQQAAQVSASVDRIAKDVQAVAEQAEQTANRVTDFDGALNKTARSATEVSTAAAGMRSVATQLSDMVARFTV